MPMLPSRHYRSEADTFLRDFIKQHPETPRKQEEGMELWWNRDAETVKAEREANRAFQDNEQKNLTKNNP